MADDELSTPLGQHAKTRRRWRLPLAVPQAVAAALGLFALVFAAWALVANDPLGGEPVVVIAAAPPSGEPGAAMPPVAAADGVHGPRSYQGPDSPPSQTTRPEAATPPATKTVTIIDGSTGRRQEVPIPASVDARAPVEQRLLEASRHGALPRIATDGTRPSEFYARPLVLAANKKHAPRVAIIVGGVGLSASVSQRAIEQLPAPVTLAFPPYGTDIQRLTSEARAAGHELLLQLPMEPFDYPDNDPGPQTLLTSLSSEQNLDRMHWLMSRFHGYVGIVNYMGARFTTVESAFAPVLKETAKRGLLYVDDGSSPRSLAGQIAGANGLPFVKAEVRIDSVPTAAHIERALVRLEARAREHGSAVGFASAVPASIERIAQWAKAAEGRGLVLVPISAVAFKPKSS